MIGMYAEKSPAAFAFGDTVFRIFIPHPSRAPRGLRRRDRGGLRHVAPDASAVGSTPSFRKSGPSRTRHHFVQFCG